MKSSIIVGVIVVIVVLFGGWWLLKSGTSSPETLTPTPLQTTDNALGTTPLASDTTLSDIPPTSPSPSVSPTVAATGATVTISDTGFSPASITVKPGTTVTFVNDGQGSHWPASDSHPTHTGLPGFDAKKGLATGGSYSFVFQEIGSWGYHDHLNARLQGTVVVQP